ncbi:LysR family transcriptional regulator [Saccharobesus litoralis]|uniref:LysR family transcriptional regulator n=1 Tax=Saccharobesus litoralis TaxID=2172099 RepID=A0A2S0VMQ6_9ALTE|nr:LysR family transcriptional regulator [Saccharobesus litoralis]AWB65504.1 LysR family transcriptional regulator [Saccharobesus litoralis]
MNIEHLKLFVRLASTHNISLAGNELGISPAVASSHINKLEEGLGVRLLHRTTRKVSLTEEGLAFLPHAEEVLASVEAARASVGAGEKLPQGTLRVAAPASFGRMHIIPTLSDFLAQYPELKIDLRLSDRMIDMVEGGFDVAIRNAALKDSTLIARKLAKDKRILCASPEYLAKYGTPAHPNDLSHHQCIVLSGINQWLFNCGNGKELAIKADGALTVDNGEALRDACVAGIGITISSLWSVYKHLEKGELVEVLPEFPLASDTAVWAVYPSSRLLAPKVRAFIDFYASRFSDVPYWEIS